MKENQKNFKICEICNLDDTNLCFQCSSYFCDSCFKFIHEKPVNSHHTKEKIDPYIPIDLKCPEHPKILNNLFCADEKGKLNLNIIKLNFLL